jgi:hypothetical protein
MKVGSAATGAAKQTTKVQYPRRAGEVGALSNSVCVAEQIGEVFARVKGHDVRLVRSTPKKRMGMPKGTV